MFITLSSAADDVADEAVDDVAGEADDNAAGEAAEVLRINVAEVASGLQFEIVQQSFCGKPREVHV